MKKVFLLLLSTSLFLSVSTAEIAWAANQCTQECMTTYAGCVETQRELKQLCRGKCVKNQNICLPCEDGCCVPDTNDLDCLTCWTNDTCGEDFCLPDISTQPNYTYNEGLGTILRGILIDTEAASALGVQAGYYRIREFRVWNMPEQKVITLNIYQDYGALATGGGIVPKQEEEWVFSIIEVDEYNSSGRKFIGYDFFGHQLSFEIQFTSSCHNVISSKLDCVDVGLSTQTYTTGVLYSCGWSSEPSWTTP